MLHVAKLNCFLGESECRQISLFIGLLNTTEIYTRVLRKLLFAFVLVKFYLSLILQEKTLHCKYVHKHRTSSACSNFFAPVTSGISTVFDRIRNSSDK